MSEYKILSVGGSIIIPKTGFDVPFLKKFRSFLVSQVQQGERFILVIGGGGTARSYQAALKGVIKTDNTTLDWLGIHTTILNAQFVRLFLGDTLCHSEVVVDPRKKVTTRKPIIVAAGWKPGMSTDADAIMLAKTYGVTEIINLSNIEYVYDKDPNLYPEAKKIEEIDCATFRKNIVGDVWTPGFNAPFDPIASKAAQKLGITVSILQGTNLAEVKKAILGKKFRGTLIR